MPTMLSHLYHALRELGANDATATAAAEEALAAAELLESLPGPLVHQLDLRFVHEAQRHPRFGGGDARLQVRMERLEGQLGRTLDAVKALSERLDSHFRMIYWALGVLIAVLAGLLWKVVR